MKKRLLLAIGLIFTINFIFAETNTEKFWNLMDEDKVDEAADFLKSWEKKNKKDPELYVCYFNMYLQNASKEQVHVEPVLPPNFKGQYMEGENENGDKIYIYSVIEYDDEAGAKALEYIDKGLSYNPKRLDMHFGKAHFYFMRGEYSKQSDVIKNIFALNKKYKDKWLWSNNESINNTDVGFEASIHEYILNWYNTGNPSVIPFMKEISILYAEQYPADVIACNDAGISAMLTNDFQTAKTYLEKGYALDPADMLLVINLARTCYNLGEIEESLKYYKILEASEDLDESAYAKKMIEQLF
jgi:tetratricopeptide (TPR) repeat protein